MRFPIFVAAVLMTAPAIAAPAPSWAIDKAHSRLTFVARMGSQTINGSFRQFDARIAFDPSNLAASRVAAVIDTASASTGDASRDQSLPTADWFNVPAFPRATVVSTSFRKLGGTRYEALGRLTIRGAARPVALPFELAISGNAARMRGTLTIDRRWFGVGQGQFATPSTVAANVQINLAINTRKAV